MLSETAYALINIVSIYNDRLLAEHSGTLSGGAEREQGPLSAARWALTCLGSVDVVLEMIGAMSNGKDGKWKMVRCSDGECLRVGVTSAARFRR